MKMLDAILSRFPVRKSRVQKEQFRQWAVAQAEGAGYKAHVESRWMLCRNHNVVMGDPESAQVIVTAHYDTPARMLLPNFITPRNVMLYLLYQVGLVLVMLLPPLAAGIAAYRLWHTFWAAYMMGFSGYIAVMLLMLSGPANPHNANDNTSGVAAVMELMTRVPADRQDTVAFILFDNEEKGMLGSMAYAGRHKAVQREKPVINLDCVGVGEHMLFFAPKKVRALPLWTMLQQTVTPRAGKTVAFHSMEKALYPSDQAQFAHGVAVCACRHRPGVGEYCSRIHTAKDTLCDPACLEVIVDGLLTLMKAL